MIKIKKESIIIRPSNLKPSSKEFEIIATINPAAVRLTNNDIILYIRVIEKLINDQDEKFYYSPRMMGEDKYKLVIDKFSKNFIEEKNPLDFILKDETKRLTYISHIRRVVLDETGFKIKSIDKKPSFYGLSWDSELGVEDPRITKIGELYIMTYVGLSKAANISTYLAISNDCKNWYRRGIIFEEQNKDVVVFPELINKEYFAFNRPEGSFEFSKPHIWMSYSKNLEDWGRSKPLILSKSLSVLPRLKSRGLFRLLDARSVPRTKVRGLLSTSTSKRGSWDTNRAGAGPPPIKTEKGWLFFYHAVTEKITKERGSIALLKSFLGIKKTRLSYNVGALLLDLKNPSKILAKSKNPIITPIKRYEKGTFEKKDVVFPTGAVVDLNKKDLLIYSGGGDIVTTVKKIAIKEILKNLEPRNNQG